jgi:hypothetical protein
MAPTYNGWDDTPEEEREALDLWESRDQLPRVFSRISRVNQIA